MNPNPQQPQDQPKNQQGGQPNKPGYDPQKQPSSGAQKDPNAKNDPYKKTGSDDR